MAATNDSQLDARINNFLERKLQRFPDIASLHVRNQRISPENKNHSLEAKSARRMQ